MVLLITTVRREDVVEDDDRIRRDKGKWWAVYRWRWCGCHEKRQGKVLLVTETSWEDINGGDTGLPVRDKEQGWRWRSRRNREEEMILQWPPKMIVRGADDGDGKEKGHQWQQQRQWRWWMVIVKMKTEGKRCAGDDREEQMLLKMIYQEGTELLW